MRIRIQVAGIRLKPSSEFTALVEGLLHELWGSDLLTAIAPLSPQEDSLKTSVHWSVVLVLGSREVALVLKDASHLGDPQKPRQQTPQETLVSPLILRSCHCSPLKKRKARQTQGSTTKDQTLNPSGIHAFNNLPRAVDSSSSTILDPLFVLVSTLQTRETHPISGDSTTLNPHRKSTSYNEKQP